MPPGPWDPWGERRQLDSGTDLGSLGDMGILQEPDLPMHPRNVGEEESSRKRPKLRETWQPPPWTALPQRIFESCALHMPRPPPCSHSGSAPHTILPELCCLTAPPPTCMTLLELSSYRHWPCRDVHSPQSTRRCAPCKPPPTTS